MLYFKDFNNEFYLWKVIEMYVYKLKCINFINYDPLALRIYNLSISFPLPAAENHHSFLVFRRLILLDCTFKFKYRGQKCEPVVEYLCRMFKPHNQKKNIHYAIFLHINDKTLSQYLSGIKYLPLKIYIYIIYMKGKVLCNMHFSSIVYLLSKFLNLISLLILIFLN